MWLYAVSLRILLRVEEGTKQRCILFGCHILLDQTDRMRGFFVCDFCAFRVVLIEQRFPRFPSYFFQEKREKQEKNGNISKLRKFNSGQIFGTLRIPIFEQKKGKSANTKFCAKK